MVIDFASARARVSANAKKRQSETLLTVTYTSEGKLAVTLGREVARRFDGYFGEHESQKLHSAVSVEVQEIICNYGEKIDVMRRVV